MIAIVLAVTALNQEPVQIVTERVVTEQTLGNSTQSFWNTTLGYRVGGVEVISSLRSLTQGGNVTSIASGAATLTQEQLASSTIITTTATTTGAAFTWTLPATSTLTSLLPNAGDTRAWLFKNTNAAATTTTIAAGTGIILDEPDGQNVVIAGGNRAKIECWRDTNTDVICSVDERIDAD